MGGTCQGAGLRLAPLGAAMRGCREGIRVLQSSEQAVIVKESWNILQIRLGRILWAVSGHIP